MNSDTDLEPASTLPEQVGGNDQTRMNIWLFVPIITYNICYKVAAEIVITSELAALFLSDEKRTQWIRFASIRT
jgi:hypothetical protein